MKKKAVRGETPCNLILRTLKKEPENSSETLEPIHQITWLRIS
jgi:hypothetical protein